MARGTITSKAAIPHVKRRLLTIAPRVWMVYILPAHPHGGTRSRESTVGPLRVRQAVEGRGVLSTETDLVESLSYHVAAKHWKSRSVWVSPSSAVGDTVCPDADTGHLCESLL